MVVAGWQRQKAYPYRHLAERPASEIVTTPLFQHSSWEQRQLAGLWVERDVEPAQPSVDQFARATTLAAIGEVIVAQFVLSPPLNCRNVHLQPPGPALDQGQAGGGGDAQRER